MPSTSLTIQDNLTEVNILLNNACQQASRHRDEVKLIAVSKGHDFSAIEAAYGYGVRDFGESYAKEMDAKIELAHNLLLTDITWHFIGAIQSNKLTSIIKADLIHSLGSLRHAQSLNTIAKKPMPVFLQVNLDHNPGRQGFLPTDLIEATSAIHKMDMMVLCGLMCIPPLDLKKPPRFWFKKMAELKNALLEQGLLQDVKLSMGMSDDFSDAIALGADYVRIGTRIFGKRI